MQWLEPNVMSWKTPGVLWARWYSAGLTNPTVGLPAARRAVLINVSMPATVGADADVPLSPIHTPFSRVWKLAAASDTSG